MAGLHRPAMILVVALFSSLASASNDPGACSSEQGNPETCRSQALGDNGLGLLQVNRGTSKMKVMTEENEEEEEGGEEGEKQGEEQGKELEWVTDEGGNHQLKDLEGNNVVEGEEHEGKDLEDGATDTEDEVKGGDAGNASGEGGDAGSASDSEESQRRRRPVTKGEFDAQNRRTNDAFKRAKREFDTLKGEVKKFEKKVTEGMGELKQEVEGLHSHDLLSTTTTTTTTTKACPLGNKLLTNADFRHFPIASIPKLKKDFPSCKFDPSFVMPTIMPEGWTPEPITTETWFFGRPKEGLITKTNWRTKKQYTVSAALASEDSCDSKCNSEAAQARFYANNSCTCYKGPSLTEACAGKAFGDNCTVTMRYPREVKSTKAVNGRTFTWYSICSKQADESKPLWCPLFAKGPFLEKVNPKLKKLPCGGYNWCQKNKIPGEACVDCPGQGSMSYHSSKFILSQCGNMTGKYDKKPTFTCMWGKHRGFYNGPAHPKPDAFIKGVKGYPYKRRSA